MFKPATRQGAERAKPLAGATFNGRTYFRGHGNPNWKGGEIVRKDGRVMICVPGHPNPSHGNYVYRYRLVMEKHIGRYLLKGEVIHHKNGDCSDDRIENLQLMPWVAHNQLHAHGLQLSGRWSRKHECCVECGTTTQKHKGRGLCSRCNDRKRWPKRSKRI